ncbi:MAG: hypothetical protein ABII00_11525 [Elusimicrobiota bacterium]
MIYRAIGGLLAAWLVALPAWSQSPWGEKALGVLVIAESGGAEWSAFVRDLRKSLGNQYPLETSVGPVAPRAMQRAIDRLQAAKIRKIVVVPLHLHSQSPEIEQIRYILGLRKYPSEAFLDAWGMRGRVVPRAKLKVPLVMSDALDDAPLAAEVLLSRAREMSREPEGESVVIIGNGAPADEDNEIVERHLGSLARKIEAEGLFRTVRGVALRPQTKDDPRQAAESERRLQALIRNLSRVSRVIVVPHLLARDGTERAWLKKLNSLFYRWRGKALLPDARLVRWVRDRVDASRDLPDMVRFKDAGQGLPPKPRKRIVQ